MSDNEERKPIFSVSKKDLRIETFIASGPGGQHRNKTDSAVRITHIETGLVAECKTNKSQHRNKKEAFRKLCVLLTDYVQKNILNVEEKDRYSAGENVVRTYNEPDDRVKDHKTGKQYSYKKTIGSGKIDEIIEDRRKKCL